MSETTITIKRCVCRSDYQDQRYGAGNRVHNYAVKRNTWRCTVCGFDKAVEKREEPKK